MAEKINKPKSRRYSAADREKAVAAVEANGGNVAKTAREFGISPGTLRGWLKNLSPAEDAAIRKGKRDLAKALEEVAWKLLDVIPEKIASAPLNQITSAFSLAFDKMQQLREESPESVEDLPLDFSGMTDEQLRQLDQLLALVLGTAPVFRANPPPAIARGVTVRVEPAVPGPPPDGPNG